MSAVTFDAVRDDPATRTMALPPVRGPRPGRHRSDEPARHPGGLVPALLAVCAAQAVVVLDLDVPVLRPAVALTTMLLLPTWVLYRRARLPADSAPARLGHAFGASLLALVVIGLAVNVAGLLAGVDKPLNPQVLGVTWLLVDVALLAWRPWVPLLPRLDVRGAVRRTWQARLEPAQALASVGIALAVLGAVRLNNGAGGGVALLAHLLVVAAYVVLLLRPGTLGRDVRVLYLTALALLLATSLRGWGITGHDVQAENYVFQLTNDAQHWSMDLLQNAYTACLSVTLLPTLLAQAGNVSGLLFFKVLMQVVFAFVPVLVFLVARRFVSRRLALVGVALVVAFPTFHADMPYLVRQEAAFLFVALMLLAATEPGAAPPLRRLLVVLFGVGVVLSHYSTTYFLLMGLFAGLLLLGLLELVHRLSDRPSERRPLVLLSPITAVVLTGTCLLWTGPATQTGGHPVQVAQDAVDSLLGRDDSPGSSDRSFAFLGRDDTTDRDRLDRFVEETMEVRADHPRRLALIKDPGPAETRPQILSVDEAPLTPAGRWLDSAGVDPGDVVVGLRLAAAGVVQLLLLAGLGWLAMARLRALRGDPAPAESSDDEALPSRVTPEIACLMVGVMAALGVVVLVPSLSVEYGVLRAFLQSMLFLAPVAAIGLWWLAGRVRRGSRVLLLGLPVVLVLVLTSTLPGLLGGGPAKLALHNAGLYHDRYIVADSDVVTAERLAEAPDSSGEMVKVLTSRHQTIRVATAGVPADEVHDRTFPTLLNVGSYVFADARMVRRRQETVFASGNRITYRYPLGELDRRLDLVHSAGWSRVYR